METSYKLHHGDCLEVMKTFADKSVDCVITDLPYGEVNRQSNGLRNLDKAVADVLTFNLEDSLKEALRLCRGSFYFFCGTGQVSLIRKSLVEADLSTRLCIWEKTNPSVMNAEYIWLSAVECCVYAKFPKATFNEFCASSVWRYPVEQNQIHPTQKNLQLMRRLVRASSDKGGTILDFTMGSGTTGVACVIEKRNFIGIEKDDHYFKVAEARIKRANGEWAEIPVNPKVIEQAERQRAESPQSELF